MTEQEGETPAFELRIEPEGATVRYLSAVSVEGIRAAVKALGSHPGFHADLPTVWDFSSASAPSGLDSDDMRRLARDVAPLRKGGRRPRVAVVTPSDANFAGARMFGGVNETRLNVQLGVFRAAEAARSWAFDPDPEGERGSGGA